MIRIITFYGADTYKQIQISYIDLDKCSSITQVKGRWVHKLESKRYDCVCDTANLSCASI